MRSALRTVLPRTLAAILTAAAAVPASAQVSFHLIAVTGDPAPGLPGVTFSWLSGPRLSDAGAVAFAADLAGDGVAADNDGSVWTDRSGALELVARTGQAAPGSEPSLFSSIPLARLDAAAVISFPAALVEPGVSKPTEIGLYAEDSALSLVLIARDGAPPLEGSTMSIGSFAADGWSAFLTDGGGGIWSDRGGALSLRAAAGDPAPGAPEDLAFAYLGEPSQVPDGRLAFRSSFAAAPDDQPAGYGVWTETDGALTPVVLTGDAVPGADPGVIFAELSAHPAPGAAAGGVTVFWARLEGPGVTPDNDTGLYAGSPPGIAAVAREGDPAPTLPGPVLAGFSRTIPQTVDGSGFATVLLRGDGISESNNSAIYRVAAGAVAGLVAREGDPAPGLADGVVFAQLPDAAVGPAASGAAAFRVRGEGIDQSNNLALYLAAADGSLQLAVRTGDLFDLRGDGSDLRTVIDILIDAGAPGTGEQAVAPDGSAAFKLDFADGTHALVVATPPTPVCRPDCNQDGKLNINDFICFQSKWKTRDPYGDYDASGTYTINDFIRFQADFVKGCG